MDTDHGSVDIPTHINSPPVLFAESSFQFNRGKKLIKCNCRPSKNQINDSNFEMERNERKKNHIFPNHQYNYSLNTDSTLTCLPGNRSVTINYSLRQPGRDRTIHRSETRTSIGNMSTQKGYTNCCTLGVQSHCIHSAGGEGERFISIAFCTLHGFFGAPSSTLQESAWCMERVVCFKLPCALW